MPALNGAVVAEAAEAVAAAAAVAMVAAILRGQPTATVRWQIMAQRQQRQSAVRAFRRALKFRRLPVHHSNLLLWIAAASHMLLCCLLL